MSIKNSSKSTVKGKTSYTNNRSGSAHSSNNSIRPPRPEIRPIETRQSNLPPRNKK